MSGPAHSTHRLVRAVYRTLKGDGTAKQIGMRAEETHQRHRPYEDQEIEGVSRLFLRSRKI